MDRTEVSKKDIREKTIRILRGLRVPEKDAETTADSPEPHPTILAGKPVK